MNPNWIIIWPTRTKSIIYVPVQQVRERLERTNEQDDDEEKD
jgi:hypothetical protein